MSLFTEETADEVDVAVVNSREEVERETSLLNDDDDDCDAPDLREDAVDILLAESSVGTRLRGVVPRVELLIQASLL